MESVAWGLAAVCTSSVPISREPIAIRVGAAMTLLGIVELAYAIPYLSVLWVIPGAILSGAGMGVMFAFAVRRLLDAVEPDDHNVNASARGRHREDGECENHEPK